MHLQQKRGRGKLKMFLFSTIKSAQRKTGQTITFKIFDIYIAFKGNLKYSVFLPEEDNLLNVLSSDR